MPHPDNVLSHPENACFKAMRSWLFMIGGYFLVGTLQADVGENSEHVRQRQQWPIM
jgi:hypothetical protein